MVAQEFPAPSGVAFAKIGRSASRSRFPITREISACGEISMGTVRGPQTVQRAVHIRHFKYPASQTSNYICVSLPLPSLRLYPNYSYSMDMLKQGEFVGSLDCGTTYAPDSGEPLLLLTSSQIRTLHHFRPIREHRLPTSTRVSSILSTSGVRRIPH